MIDLPFGILDHSRTPEEDSEDELRRHIFDHPLSKKLRRQSGVSERWMNDAMPAALRAYNLTAGTLYGPGMLEVPPLTFTCSTAGLPSMTQIIYVGSRLSGHPGIVHGGMLATILDEGLARACFPAFASSTGVTASLKIDYRTPCPADSFVVLRAWTTKVERRKAWCNGRIELLLDGDDTQEVILAEAEGLFVEPRNAHQLLKMNDW